MGLQEDYDIEEGTRRSGDALVRSVDLQQTAALVKLTRKGDQGAAADYAIEFVKAADGWEADYHLP